MVQTQSPANSAVSSPPVRRSPSVAHFNIETGRFAIMVEVNHDDEPDYAEAYECAAYSGAPGHVNAPGDVALRGLGPIPPGEWHVGLPHNHARLGPLVFRLRPSVNTEVYGRDEFYIHGDKADGPPRSASTGCIVLHRAAREAMQFYRVRWLTVT